MLRSLVLAACLATTATATAPRPALLRLRGGGGAAKAGGVDEQPKTGKLWAARHVETKARVAGQRGPSGWLAEAGRSLGQPEA